MTAELNSIIAAATPLIFATIGEMISEKSGVINLSLEGSISLAAMTGFAAALVTGNALVGFVAATAVGALVAALIAFASIELRLNQIAVGFVLFVLTGALARFLGRSYVGERGESVPPLEIPLLSDIPFFGRVLFDHNLSVYASFLVIIAAYVFLYRSKRGLELRGVGERPEAAFARGIAVNRLRYLYTILGGAMVGVGGAAVSLDVTLGWREGLTRNLGWIALAIVIFGGWHPFRVAIGCYLLGFLSFVALQLQDDFPSVSQVLGILPFVLMILMLTIVYSNWFRRVGDRYPAWREFLASDPPSAIGTAFSPE